MTSGRIEPLRSSEGVQRLLPRLKERGRLRVLGVPGLGRTELMLRLGEALKSERGMMVGLSLVTGEAMPPVMPVLAGLGEALGRALKASGQGPEAILERLPGSLWPSARALLKVMRALGDEEGHGPPGSRVRLREVGDALQQVSRKWVEQPEQQAWLTRRVMMAAWQELTPRLGKFRWMLLLDGWSGAAEKTRALVELLLGLPEEVFGGVFTPDGPDPTEEQAGSSRRLQALPSIVLHPWSGTALLDHWQSFKNLESRSAKELLEQTQGSPRALMQEVLMGELQALAAGPGELRETVVQLLVLLSLAPAPLNIEPALWLELLRVSPQQLRAGVEWLEHRGAVLFLPAGIQARNPAFLATWRETLPTSQVEEAAERLERALQIHHSRDLSLGCGLPHLEALVQVLEVLGRRGQGFRMRALLAESWLEWGEWGRALGHLERLEQQEATLTSGRHAGGIGRILNLQSVAQMNLGNHSDAAALAERAARLLRQGGEISSSWAARVNLLRALAETQGIEQVRAVHQELLLEAGDQAEELIWQAWWILGQAELEAGNANLAVEAWNQALQAGSVWGVSPHQSRMHAELGLLLLRLERTEEGVAQLYEAGSLYLREGRRASAALTFARLGAVLEVLGQVQEAHRVWLQALDAVVEDGHGEETWCTLCAGFAGFLLRIGAWDEGLGVLQRALERAQASGYSLAERQLLEEGAHAYELADQPELAVGYARACVRLARMDGAPLSLSRALNTLGFLLYCLGSNLEARGCLEEGLEVARQAGDKATEAVIQHNLGVTLAGLEALEEGVVHLRSAAVLRGRLGDDQGARASLGAAARLLEALEDYRGAALLLRDQLLPRAAPGTGEAGQVERHLARLSALASAARKPGWSG